MPFFVPLALLALVVAAAMALCGLACRWRYRSWWICLWLFLSLPAVWVAVSAPLHYLCRMAWPGSVGLRPLIPRIGPFMVVVIFATLLPFLILSSASPFFRERLKALLHVKPEVPPAMAPLPDAQFENLNRWMNKSTSTL